MIIGHAEWAAMEAAERLLDAIAAGEHVAPDHAARVAFRLRELREESGDPQTYTGGLTDTERAELEMARLVVERGRTP